MASDARIPVILKSIVLAAMLLFLKDAPAEANFTTESYTGSIWPEAVAKWRGQPAKGLKRRTALLSDLASVKPIETSKPALAMLPEHVRLSPTNGTSLSRSQLPIRADFVAEVGDDRIVTAGANFSS